MSRSNNPTDEIPDDQLFDLLARRQADPEAARVGLEELWRRYSTGAYAWLCKRFGDRVENDADRWAIITDAFVEVFEGAERFDQSAAKTSPEIRKLIAHWISQRVEWLTLRFLRLRSRDRHTEYRASVARSRCTAKEAAWEPRDPDAQRRFARGLASLSAKERDVLLTSFREARWVQKDDGEMQLEISLSTDVRKELRARWAVSSDAALRKIRERALAKLRAACLDIPTGAIA